jgi:cellulose biosynthesis protein BcsQ
MPAIVYDRKSKGSQAYLKLADEILKKNNNKEAA